MRRSLACCICFLASCTARSITDLDLEPRGEASYLGSASTERPIDILFVVDNSNSMRQEQDSLAENFKGFMNVLAAIEGERAEDAPVGTQLSVRCALEPEIIHASIHQAIDTATPEVS